MVTEPTIDKKHLIQIAENEFQILVKSLTFNPKGWASWSYIVETTDNQKYFLKIYRDNNFNLQALDFLNRLSNKCEVKNITYPINTKSGEIILHVSGYQVVVFNYISGVTSSEQKLNDEQLEKLGELLARIHQSKNVIGPYFKKEDFNNPYHDQVLSLLGKLDSLQSENNYQQEAKELYLKYKGKFLNEIELLDQLKLKLENSNLDFVNCHGEPSPDNIMIDDKGEIYLIDWDFPLFAPKEKDLLFFGDRYNQILKGYGKVSRNMVINKEAESFYQHLWNAQEIENFGSELLLGKISEEEYKANLKELKNFLVYSKLESN